MLTPKHFLQIGGVVLIVVAILGFVGVIGPTPEKSIFGAGWYFDNAENWAHLVIGVVAVIASAALAAGAQRQLTLVVGVVAVLIGIYSIFSQNFLGAGLENPADTLLHIVVGVWALASAKKS